MFVECMVYSDPASRLKVDVFTYEKHIRAEHLLPWAEQVFTMCHAVE